MCRGGGGCGGSVVVAVERVAFTSVLVLYEYSLVGEVRYSMTTPHTSARPAIEMIIVPDSIDMAAVGVCRVHAVPDPVYCATLLVPRLAVSVIQTDLEDAHTNPYGLNGYAVDATVTPVPAVVGGVVPVVNELRPPAAGLGDADESVYMSADPSPHPIEPTLSPVAAAMHAPPCLLHNTIGLAVPAMGV